MSAYDKDGNMIFVEPTTSMDMTSAEAYGMWFHSEYGRYPDPMVDQDFLAWKAACEWQKQKDASIVEDFVDEHTFYRAGQVILNQEKGERRE